MLPAPLAALGAYRQFITYELVPDPDRPGKTIKRPTHWRTGTYCKVNDPANWTDAATAYATGRPVGFVFTRNDPFYFLDIDGALQPNNVWGQLATDLCASLAGAAVEVSQSGKGLHVIGSGTVPPHSCKNILLNIELYTEERFVALTGTHATGNAAHDCTAAIGDLVTRYFPHNPHGEIAGWTAEPVDGWGGPATDEDLLKAALASGKNGLGAAFGDKHVTFEDLWTANADALARRWPGKTDGYDASQADAALAGHLAFWTGKNCERMRGLMEQSALKRGKWDDRPAYLETTVMKANAVVKNVAKPKPLPPPIDPVRATVAGIELRDVEMTLTAPGQIELFAGCVYIVDLNKIWVPATGALLDRARFDVVYGGFIFVLDNVGEKKTDSAWDCFTKSRFYKPPTADRICFRPEFPPGAVLKEEGETLVNIYIPVNTHVAEGDPSPFLNHLAKMLPNERDRLILLHYLARCIQSPGFKAQWWPVIQGAEGNGKSLVERLMAFCIGYRYAHLVNPDAMAKTGNQFNKWVMGNLWVGFEEIYVGPNRREFLETFKSTVTNDRIALEGKGADQLTGDNRVNGLMLTNHAEAVPISVDTRRYAVFLTAQQSAEDILRDGMGGAYFPDLYDWFYGRGKFAPLGPMYGARVMNGYLKNFVLTEELDPARLCVRAPVTSSRDAVLAYSRGRAEMEILEAVEEGRTGFAGGWISSIAVDKLLDSIRASVPRTKRREMLKGLGYDYHPHLIEGRVNNVVMPDNGKPRLFVKEGHLACALEEPALIAKAYTNAQNSTAMAAAFGEGKTA